MLNHIGATICICHVSRFLKNYPDCLCGNICMCLSMASSEQWKTAQGCRECHSVFAILHPKNAYYTPQHLLLGTKYQLALFGNNKFTLYLRKHFSCHMWQEETTANRHRLFHHDNEDVSVTSVWMWPQKTSEMILCDNSTGLCTSPSTQLLARRVDALQSASS